MKLTCCTLSDHPDCHPGISAVAVSRFVYGIVTFHVGNLFRTKPRCNLFATGLLNHPNDGISPLTGVIETDWLPYPFTMNWQITRRGTVRLVRGEPLCTVFPVPATARAETEPVDARRRAKSP